MLLSIKRKHLGNLLEAVARREVFVSVSAFKPKVKNVSPRAWTEPIVVLLLLLPSSFVLTGFLSSLVLLLLSQW
jgi:hypothetical protein